MASNIPNSENINSTSSKTHQFTIPVDDLTPVYVNSMKTLLHILDDNLSSDDPVGVLLGSHESDLLLPYIVELFAGSWEATLVNWDITVNSVIFIVHKITHKPICGEYSRNIVNHNLWHVASPDWEITFVQSLWSTQTSISIPSGWGDKRLNPRRKVNHVSLSKVHGDYDAFVRDMTLITLVSHWE